MKIAQLINNSLIDYPGHLACVIFTAGCNWNCWYCLNHDLICDDNTQGVSEAELFKFLDSRKNWLDGVVICGGEPTLHKDLPQLIAKVKELGFDVKLDTNGTNLDMLKYLIDNKMIDYVAMDIKAPLEKYEKIIQKPLIYDIRKTIEYLMSCGIDYEFRTTVSPDLTFDDILEIAKTIKGAKLYNLQQYKKPKEDSPKPFEPRELEGMKVECNNFVKTELR